MRNLLKLKKTFVSNEANNVLGFCLRAFCPLDYVSPDSLGMNGSIFAARGFFASKSKTDYIYNLFFCP